MKPRARRTCTLIAKSLQTLANMASFGTKEHWMEPMNSFLTQHRESFKSFIDDVCYVPTPLSSAALQTSPGVSPTDATGIASVETHLSYTTPMTIMHRLPPTSREGFPSLPYLIDQARAYADLIQLWLEATSNVHEQHEISSTGRSQPTLSQAIEQSEGDLRPFHELCMLLHGRTQECLSRAERAERPNSALSFRWDELIDQLERPPGDPARDRSFDKVADRIASDPTIVPPPHLEGLVHSLRTTQQDGEDSDEDDSNATRMYESSIAPSENATPSQPGTDARSFATNSLPGSLRHGPGRRNGPTRPSIDSHTASASASASNVSSAVSSDTEHTTGTTALPSYEREVRHKAETAGSWMGSVGFLQGRTEKKVRDKEKDKDREGEERKERRRGKAMLPALRKKKEKEGIRGPMSPQSS